MTNKRAIPMSKRAHSETPGVTVAHVQSWKQRIVTHIVPIYGTATSVQLRPNVAFEVSSIDVSVAGYVFSNKILGVGVDEWQGQLGQVLCAAHVDGDSPRPVTWQFPRPIPVEQVYTIRLYEIGTGSKWITVSPNDADRIAVTITFHRAP